MLRIGNWVMTKKTQFTPHFETGQNCFKIFSHSLRFRHLPIGLRQRCACWIAGVNDCTAAACVERCCSSGATTRSHYCGTDRPTLANSRSTNWIQTLHSGSLIMCRYVRQGMTRYVSGESDRIFVKILSQMHPCTRKFRLNFGSNPDPEHILLVGRMRSPTALVFSAFLP